MKWVCLVAIVLILATAALKTFEIHENNKYRLKMIEAVSQKKWVGEK